MPSDILKYPAAATYTFGIPTFETAFTADTIEQNDIVDVYEQKNEFGEIVEVVTYNPRGEITISGETTAALTAILGKTYLFANLVTTQFPNAVSGAQTIVRAVQYTQQRGVNQRGRITATYYPLVTA
jgi:hypothetical protein